MIRRILDLPAGAGEKMTWSSEDSDNEEVQARRKKQRARFAALSEETLDGAEAEAEPAALNTAVAPGPAPAPAPRACSRLQACGWRDVWRCRNRVRDAEEGCPATFFHLTLSTSGADKTDCKYWMRAEFADVRLNNTDAHCGFDKTKIRGLLFETGGRPETPAGLVGIIADALADNEQVHMLVSDADDGDAARFVAHAAVERLKHAPATNAIGLDIRRAMQRDALGGMKPTRQGLADLLARFSLAINEVDERRRVNDYLEAHGL